jgi:hypothetical protein
VINPTTSAMAIRAFIFFETKKPAEGKISERNTKLPEAHGGSSKCRLRMHANGQRYRRKKRAARAWGPTQRRLAGQSIEKV